MSRAARGRDREPGPPRGVRLHYWPGAAPFIRTPGARLPCRIRPLSGAALGTGDPAAVTCQRCAEWLRDVRNVKWQAPAPWIPERLVLAGLVDAGAAEPQPAPVPYRNPRLPEYDRDRPGPLAALADDLAAAAEAARARGDALTFGLLRSFAARVVDLHEQTKPGAGW